MSVFKLLVPVSLLLLCSCTVFKHSVPDYKPEMVLVEGGTFFFGDVFEEQNTDALPVHRVNIESFYIGRYEVTYNQYDSYAKKNGKELPDDNGDGRGNRAVSNIDWNEALEFCESFGYRLPTETEWEFAARSGGKDEMFAGTNTQDSLMFYAFTDNSGINTSVDVGLKKPNRLGIYDMSGNVFEWIGDFYQFYSEPDNMHDHENDGIRLIRGGSFSERISTNRTYWRVGTLKNVKNNDIGFRCAKSVK